MSELENAIQDSIPDDATGNPQTPDVTGPSPDDVTAEPSSADHEGATSQKAGQEPPFHEHPRWKEVQEEKRQALESARRAEERAEKLAEKLGQLVDRVSTPQVQDKDPYEGMDAEARLFYQNLDSRIKKQVDSMIGVERQKFLSELQESKATTAALLYNQFRRDHPDVKPNSPEESQIAQKFNQGYSLDDAYKLVMGDINHQRQIEKLRQEMKQKDVQSKKQKLAANQETGSVSATSPITPQKKKSTREFVEEWLAQNG